METLAIIGSFITLLGSLFLLLAAIGIIRMPDVYNRIQTGTKATTFGSILSLTGLLFIHPDWTGKIIILIGFVFFTNPISSHVLARTSHLISIPLSNRTVVDKLKEYKL